jgi:hypothetical protein
VIGTGVPGIVRAKSVQIVTNVVGNSFDLYCFLVFLLYKISNGVKMDKAIIKKSKLCNRFGDELIKIKS